MALFTFEHEDAPPAPVPAQTQTQTQTASAVTGVDIFMSGADDMDKTPHGSITVGTPPINIASPIPKRLISSSTAEKTAQAPADKLDFDLVLKKAKKNKKKKKATKGGAPAPATNMVRGFRTPVTSCGEDSDYGFSVVNTPRLGPTLSGFPSVTSSPALRPTSAAGGISNLKQQLEALSIGSRTDSPFKGHLTGMLRSGLSSNASVSGMDSDSDRTEMTSFEVNLDEDFFSSDVLSKTSTLTSQAMERSTSNVRKMAAEDFERLTCLGKGSYGTVLLVRQKTTGRLYAQKQFRKATLTVHKKLIEQTNTERAILESVTRHPFVVKLFYAFQDHEKLYLILEYAQGGELFHHLKSERMFSEEVAAFYMAEMILALDHLHRLGIVYRDLKPENCLLDSEGHLLLTDFGLSKVAVDENETCRSFLGTVEYMAPEVIQGVEYGMAVDWWSLGALGFDLLTGSPPFTGNNNAKIQEAIVKKKLVMPYYLGPDAKDLLTRLLRKEPKKRLGATMPKDLQTIKAHRFFRKIDWKKLEAREMEPPIQPLITDPELAENFDSGFTDLPLSPVATRKGFDDFMGDETNPEPNPFGGFSYVASSSLLEGALWDD
ncbi:serine/threonine-protein kinase-like protein psk1 [Pleomassaria siparia CBS 279.74]|uniref:Serine/threonine-protein kinase-like protein psk1 n=1 Tax=Pleomassaria siparia CBS 279.74 TaxID=1314801 RepID=A0A6G1KI01_9PLEO|nr:serine/threonine-protein kinase-like protein psk1 [Pleomassaria siparia CBS 279.74]